MWVDNHSSLISSELQAAGEHWTGCLGIPHSLSTGFWLQRGTDIWETQDPGNWPGKGAGQLPSQLPKILPEQSLNK